MSVASSELDEAYERLADSGFELPNGFVFHGPMACEALAALGCDNDIEGWARWFARDAGEPAPESVAPPDGDAKWQGALGNYRLLGEWVARFERAIGEEGWSSVVEVWVPRLLPSLSVALFHGAIRTAHAVRAVKVADTGPRRAELARGLGYWAARFRPGQPIEPGPSLGADGLREGVITAAAEAARRYLAQPTIFYLHGVTGAMAVEMLADHLDTGTAAGALAQIHAEHAALYGQTAPVRELEVTGIPDETLAVAAAGSHDAHQVKLIEACRRGFEGSGDQAFRAAAERVVAS